MEGSRRNWLMIIIMLCGMLLYPIFVQATDQDSLNSVIYDYASKNIPKPRTGKMYEVSLPSNLSGIEASIIRLRTNRLWKNGVNSTSFEIPPKILPQPFTRRVDIVYRNLGNRSRNYYGVPNHTLVAPVIGFLAYDSDAGPTNHGRLVQLSIRGDHHIDNPIIVRFRNIVSIVGMKCVRFDSNGTFGLSELTVESSCLASGEGHFSVVVPNYDRPDKNEEKGVIVNRWIIGLILSGVMGLVLIIGIMVYRLVKWKKVKEMEKMSERSEALDTIWIGNSKMFAASGIRTPPVIENTYVP